MSGFKRAERRQVKLKLGIAGPSGSGKTWTGLRIARGLLEANKGYAGRIALIDTENKSASLYASSAGMPEFDTLELEPPYTVDKYIAAIEMALKEKYDLVIVDSVSHVWSGEGGLLQEKETLDSRGGNSYTNWAKMTPKWNKFVSAILHSDIHMICTMRSKQDYVLEANDKGKQAPKKVGMAPQVREGFEYELTAVLDMDMSHHAQASKDRTSLFNGRTWQPDEKTGQELFTWLNTGKAPEPKPEPVNPEVKKLAEDRTKALQAVLNPVNWPTGTVAEYCVKAFATAKLSELNDTQFAELIGAVRSKTAMQAKAELQPLDFDQATASPPLADSKVGG